MSMTVEQFLSFSESEQLQTVKELNDTGNVKTIIDVLTSVGIENLSISLLGELGRAYNNNGNEKEAIKVLESIDEEYRDAVWYYRCAYAYGAIASDNNESYTSDIMKQMLRLVDQGVRLAQEKNLDDIKSYCFVQILIIINHSTHFIGGVIFFHILSSIADRFIIEPLQSCPGILYI